MKTAVEYLSYVYALQGAIYQDDIDKAIEMEKEQKCRFANEYADNVMAGMMKTAEDFLTEYETFKK